MPFALRNAAAAQIGQGWRISDVACGDLHGPNCRCLFVDPEVDLAPAQPFWAAMLAIMPLG